MIPITSCSGGLIFEPRAPKSLNPPLILEDGNAYFFSSQTELLFHVALDYFQHIVSKLRLPPKKYLNVICFFIHIMNKNIQNAISFMLNTVLQISSDTMLLLELEERDRSITAVFPLSATNLRTGETETEASLQIMPNLLAGSIFLEN